MSRQQWRLLVSAVALLGSGAAAAVGFALLSSSRWTVVTPEVAVFVILFVQWQTLAQTIAKLGIDQIVFAAITHHPGTSPRTAAHFRRVGLPLAALAGVVVGIVFSPLAGAVCAASVLLDTHSAVLVASENARQRFAAVAFANLLNYPLFFLLLLLSALVTPPGAELALLLFLASSVARWAFLRFRERDVMALPPVDCHANVAMGVNQLQNYMLFKVDQVLLGFAAVVAVFALQAEPDFVRKYLFLARFPELVAGIAVALGGIMLPRLYVSYPVQMAAWGERARRSLPWLAAYVAAGVGGILVYTILWRGTPLPLTLALPFGVGALLIMPAFALTYSMVRQGYLRGLLRNQLVALGAGGVLLGLSLATRSLPLLALLVPVQLAAFVGLCIALPWGRYERTFGRTGEWEAVEPLEEAAQQRA